MPFLEVIGITPTNQSFLFAVCFMQNEQTEGYQWALETLFQQWLSLPQNSVLITDRDLAFLGAINAILPNYAHLLCIWHINKAVLAKAKSFIAISNNPDLDKSKKAEFDDFMKHWYELCQSNTKDEYILRLNNLKTQFQHYPGLILYLTDTWLIYKEKFIRFWIQYTTHFGNLASSRSEGAHVQLKRELNGSNGDLSTVFTAVDRVINQQQDDIQDKIESDKCSIPKIAAINRLYDLIRGFISNYSIRLIHRQRELALQIGPIGECTGYFTRSMGLPCKHRLFNLIRLNQSILLDEIDPFWHIKPTLGTQSVIILPPDIPQKAKKGGKRGADCLIRKEEGPKRKQKAPARCSGCGEANHTFRSCPMRKN